MELDTLKNNDGVLVIYNSTNGVVKEFYGWKDFIKKLNEFGITEDKIYTRFSKEEIEEFFTDNGMEDELPKEFKSWEEKLNKLHGKVQTKK